MPAPTLITDLSQTAGSNQPVGSVDTPSTLDDVQRAHASFIAMLRDGVGFTNPAVLASASTCSIGGVSALGVEISGTTTITSFGTTYNGPRLLRFQGVLTLTHSSSLNLPGAANITTAAGDTCIAVPNQALSGWNVYAYQRASLAPGAASTLSGAITSSGLTMATARVLMRTTAGTGAVEEGVVDSSLALTSGTLGVLLRGYIDGLTLSTAGASTTFSVGAGVAANSSSTLMTLAASISKTTSAWVVGSGNGGLDTGAIANSTWYHAHLIRRPDTGVVDVLVSLSPTAPTLPANYTQFRRIGSMRTNGSGQWTSFLQVGDQFMLAAPVLDVDITSEPATAVLRTLTIPTGVKVEALMNAYQNNTGVSVSVLFSDPDLPDVAPSQTAAPLGSIGIWGTVTYPQWQVRCMSNTSGQIRTRHTSGSGSNQFKVATLGWIDARGKNA